MNGKQRALAAIRGEAMDRPSFLPSIDLVYAAGALGRGAGECFADESLHARALEAALARHPGIDGLYVNLCLSRAHSRRLDAEHWGDSGGMTWKVPPKDVGTVSHREILSLEDPRIRTENPLEFGILDTFQLISPQYKEQFLIVPGLTGPYSHLVFMLGLEEVLLLMYDDPEALEATLAVRTGHALQWADHLAEAGAEAVWIGEGAASSSLISPDAYARFVLPYVTPVVDRLRAHGILSIMHVCGDIRPAAHLIAAAGSDAIDVDHMVPMAYVAERAARPVCVKGNLDPVAVQNATPEGAQALARQVLADSPNPMILSTGCLVTRDTPPENLDAIAAACLQA